MEKPSNIIISLHRKTFFQLLRIFQSPTCGHGNTSFCANFVKLGRPEVGEIARYLMDQKNKISARSPAAASARIAPKICQVQLQTIVSEFPKFHPNLFTSGGVIVERVNIVQTRHKVFAILGEASASSLSNKVMNAKYSVVAEKPSYHKDDVFSQLMTNNYVD